MNDLQSKSTSSQPGAATTPGASNPQAQSLVDSEYEVASAKGADKAGGKGHPGAGQSVKARAEIRLNDSRTFGNLGDVGTYVINPAISATLGPGPKELGDPIVSVGDTSLGQHVQLHVENSSVKRETAAGGHAQYRYLARYQLKNRNSWKTPNMSFGMKVANTLELGGKGNLSGEAGENALVENVKVQGGVEGNINNKLHGEAEAAIKEFSLGATDEYFDHWHDVEMVVNSGGYARAQVIESNSRGTKGGIEVEREASSQHVVIKGGHPELVQTPDQKDKKAMRLLK